MKKFILPFIFLGSISLDSYGQCTACAIDPSCSASPVFPASCPSILPSDTAQQPYETTITMFLPATFQITDPITATVTLTQVSVTGVSGMPPGLNWTAYNHSGVASTVFYPSSAPPATERICAKICGTPLVPGYYEIVVSAIVVVQVPGYGTQTQSQAFVYPITIFPNPSGNSAFTMSTASGCGEINDLTFAPVLVSGGDPLYEYTWDFGNGATSTDENPAPVDYTVPGTYYPSLTTYIKKYKITNATASLACSDDWCDFSLFGNCLSDPEPYFTVQDNTSVQESSAQGSTASTWTNVNMNIESDQLIVSFFEEDGVFNADDELGSTIVNITTGPGVYNFNIPANECSGVGVTGTLTVGTYVFSTLSDTDQVTVYPLPVVGTVMSSPDSACVGESTTLTAAAGFASYQWYFGTNVVSGAISNTHTTITAGTYSVEVTDTNGCFATSSTVSFTAVAYPQQPLLLLGGAGATTLTLDNPQSYISYQWLLNGNPIAGQVGSSYTAISSGNYSLQATNLFGCSTVSEEVLVVVAGIDEIQDIYQTNIYPNPNNGSFTLSMNIQETSTIRLQMTDVVGRVVYDQNLGLQQGAYQEQINVNHLSEGVYMLRLLDDKQQLSTKTLVLSK